MREEGKGGWGDRKTKWERKREEVVTKRKRERGWSQRGRETGWSQSA